MNLLQNTKYALGLMLAVTGFTSVNAMENVAQNTQVAEFNTPTPQLNAQNFTPPQLARKAKRSRSGEDFDATGTMRLDFDAEASPTVNNNDDPFHTPVSKRSRCLLPLNTHTDSEISRPQPINLRSLFDNTPSPTNIGLAHLTELPPFPGFHHTAALNLNFLLSPDMMNFLNQVNDGADAYEEDTANELADDAAFPA